MECEYFYFTIVPKAILTTGRDTTTGKTMTKTFTGTNEKEAINKALSEKIKLEQNGGIRIITKSNKTLYDLSESVIKESFRLGKIKANTKKNRYTKKIAKRKIRYNSNS